MAEKDLQEKLADISFYYSLAEGYSDYVFEGLGEWILFSDGAADLISNVVYPELLELAEDLEPWVSELIAEHYRDGAYDWVCEIVGCFTSDPLSELAGLTEAELAVLEADITAWLIADTPDDHGDCLPDTVLELLAEAVEEALPAAKTRYMERWQTKLFDKP